MVGPNGLARIAEVIAALVPFVRYPWDVFLFFHIQLSFAFPSSLLPTFSFYLLNKLLRLFYF